jgi:hypothetical protein
VAGTEGEPMNVPIGFPSQVEVISEEVARFRSLSPEDRVAALNEMFRLYQALAERSGRPDVVRLASSMEKDLSRTAVMEFAQRHESN